ncbi:threonylcarbamoyl-AMP synthase [Candidatus Shapirobacteria bacterium]|nr:threonylcarbamoyl-AMP synthase [Candidatus Shapirobacteria bacterium]
MRVADIKAAAKVIRNGGLVVFPSDTVYILAVDPTNQVATDKLLAFKNRWVGKAISVAVLDQKMAEEYVVLNENSRSIYSNLLPGPFTVVSEGKHKVAKGIEAENGTLGIRIPDNKWISDLVREVGGPVTATSANLSGRTPHYSIDSFKKTLSKKKLAMVDLFVDGGKLPRNKPSTVIDATEPEIKILRRGDLVPGKSQLLTSKSEKETEDIAEFLYKKFKSKIQNPKSKSKPLVFGLSGDLGCGKTVFSRKVGHLIGVKEKITSPTFVIINEYDLGNNKGQMTNDKQKKFVHMDLYRLGNKYEFEEINFLEQFTEGTVACVEWVENMGEEYMKRLKETCVYVPVNFRYIDEKTREICF